MTIYKHELLRGRKAFIIWTGVITFMLAVCIIIYPEMKSEMAGMNEMFASMGSLTAAFGMDKLNFGTLIGYYAIECGNVLGLGGAFFAALTAIEIICKEERIGTAEFLLTHPQSRTRIITEKLLSVITRVVALNVVVVAFMALSILVIGESIPWSEMLLLHAAYLILQIELALICFGISAFIRKGGLAIGLGIAALMYLFNIIANITDSVKFLSYITPYGYCDGATIISEGSLDAVRILIGMAISLFCVAAAYATYPKKDIK
ncbi:MAG: ABC transporter permease subunit [Lachnospiraceae bacterium]|nr:ABC transporter permease subunit [Lachnospiraceae bacterium]